MTEVPNPKPAFIVASSMREESEEEYSLGCTV